MSDLRHPWVTESDEALMRRVAAGDGQAFEVIYARHNATMQALARGIVGRIGLAEEATQDAFLALWRNASSFDPERARLSTWLHTMVRNRSIDLLRQASPRARYEGAGLDETAAERIEAPERTEDQVIVTQEYSRALRLVAELPPDQREVIGLSYLGEYSQTEIAARVGIPTGTVKGRARLALQKLRDAAERESATATAA